MTPPRDAGAPPQADALRWRWTRGLALVGGNVCGFLGVWEALSPALRHQAYSYGTGHHTALALTGILLGTLVLPIAVTSLAPRKSFLWATATAGIVLAWSLMDRVVARNGPGLIHDLTGNATAFSLTLLIFCGPISLLRLLRRRGREGQARRLEEYQVWMRQAQEAQAGVWPPPIRPSGPEGGNQ